MKTKILNTVFLFHGGATTASQLIELYFNVQMKKFKFSYRNGNAYEEFKIEMFDGTQLNHIASMTDLGVKRNTSAYCTMDESETLLRVNMLLGKGYDYIKLLF